jgi:glutathionylspermidine amidase/synthetase
MKYILLSLFGLLIYNGLKKEKFGTILGNTKEGVIAYSSYYENNIREKNYINGIFTGIKWQCVEFARRYLIQVNNITFDAVDNAYDIFNLNNFKTLNSVNIPIQKYSNGSNILPHIGSLIIWSKDVDIKETGHVAVVTDVTKNYIKIAEQNYDNKNYSRKIYINNNILDSMHLLGWINYKNI